MDTRTRDESPSDGETTEPVEGTRQGRFALSVLIVATVLAVLASTMPASELRDGLVTVVRPYMLATGLDQTWGVFAPDPPRVWTSVFARVDRADGTSATYELPDDAGLGAYWTYRWRKYADQMRLPTSQRERAAFASWSVDRDREVGGRPSRITLLRRSSTNLPPGPGPDSTPLREVPFYSQAVAR